MIFLIKGCLITKPFSESRKSINPINQGSDNFQGSDKKINEISKSFKSAVIFAPMRSNKLVRAAIILLILILNIGCDQVSKSIVRKDMTDTQVIGFLSNHVTLEKVENTGAFLSLGDSLGGPLRYIILMILPLVAVFWGLGYILIKNNMSKYKLLGIIFIIGGGVGNLYDRVIHGSVTDFMHIDFIIFQTGVFNVADMSIMAGMFIIILDTYLTKKEEEKADEDAVIEA